MVTRIASGRIALSALCVAALLLVSSSSYAQMGDETPVLVRGAHVLVGDAFEAADILFVGKKVEAVGRDLKSPGARVVKADGKYIVPSVIDAGANLGVYGTSSSRGKAYYRVQDRLNLYDHDPFNDALEAGIAYVYLRNPVKTGVGGQGCGLLVPDPRTSTTDGIVLKGTEAVHMAVGKARGSLARVFEVDALEGRLKAAKDYRKSWEKYEEALEEYEKDLKEWAKKEKKKNKSKKKSSKKKDAKGDKDGDEKKKDGDEGDKKKDKAVDHDDHAHADDDHEDEDHEDEDHADEDEHDDHDHDGPNAAGVIPGYSDVLREAEKVLARYRSHPETHYWAFPAPRLHPTTSVIGDGTEPHVRNAEGPAPFDFSDVQVSTCTHCGGYLDADGPAHDHDHDAPAFDYFEFAPEEKKDDEKKGDSKDTAKKKDDKKKKGDKKPKKPKEPRYDPALEEMAKALQGKVKVRLEVHRAEDIENVLDMLKRYPLDVVLEGMTEGYRVVGRVAAAGYPVVLAPLPVMPIQGRSLETITQTFNFPFPVPFVLPPSISVIDRPARLPLTGRANPRNAALLHHAGVPVVIGSVGGEAGATPLLLSSAAYAVSHGLPRGEALRSVTARAAEAMGWGERLGELSKGKRASFVVYDRDPLDPAARADRIYVDGKRYFSKN